LAFAPGCFAAQGLHLAEVCLAGVQGLHFLAAGLQGLHAARAAMGTVAAIASGRAAAAPSKALVDFRMAV
jgi:hypothetical protein